jgi:hypothetical protein
MAKTTRNGGATHRRLHHRLATEMSLPRRFDTSILAGLMVALATAPSAAPASAVAASTAWVVP